MLEFMNEKAYFDDSNMTKRNDKKLMSKLRLREMRRKVFAKLKNNEKNK